MKTAAIEQADRHLARRAREPIDHEHLLELAYRRIVKPDDVVIDIGAHKGRHSVVFVELVGPSGRVLAAEPLPHLAAALRAKFASVPQLAVIEAAVTTQAGTTEFVHVLNAPAESGLLARAVFNVKEVELAPIKVVATTLDDIARPLTRLDYIKMDVEGGEITCINGGIATLEKFRPTLSVEYGYGAYHAYGHTRGTLFDLAERLSYVLGDLYGNPIRTREEWDYICDNAYWDFFMIPAECVDAWASAVSQR